MYKLFLDIITIQATKEISGNMRAAKQRHYEEYREKSKGLR